MHRLSRSINFTKNSLTLLRCDSRTLVLSNVINKSEYSISVGKNFFERHDNFHNRHIGPRKHEKQEMLEQLNLKVFFIKYYLKYLYFLKFSKYLITFITYCGYNYNIIYYIFNIIL